MRRHIVFDILALLLAQPQPATAESLADFYRGPTVNLTVGYSADGGCEGSNPDTHAALLKNAFGASCAW